MKNDLNLEATFNFLVLENPNFKSAYGEGTVHFGQPVVLVNMEAIIKAIYDEKGELSVEDFKDGVLRSVSHEFIHAMQEWLGKEFDEYETETILGLYKEKWNTLSESREDIDDAVVGISDMLDLIESTEATTVEEFKGKIKDVFSSYTLWKEANDKAK